MTLRSPQGPPVAVRLPEASRILAWVYIGRCCLAVAVFLAASPIWTASPPHGWFTVALLLGTTLLFTGASAWYTHLRAQHPRRWFLYTQSIFDTLLVSGVVHVTGGLESAFAPLYILVICAAGVLLPLLGGILVGVLASIAYFSMAAVSANGPLGMAVFLQIALFTVVALVTGYLGDRLRQTGTVLGKVETELRLLRLDTDDILGSLNTGIMIVDGRGELGYLNPAAAELAGLEAQRWLGKPVISQLDGVAPGLGGVIARSAETRQPIRRFETRETEEGGRVFGVSTTVMERPAPELPAVSVIFQDITERKRMDTLRLRSERLEAVAELSASLAHEIKNPLASIRSAVEQLGGADVDAEDRRVLEGLVIRESDRLSRLLSEFIDYARVRARVADRVEIRTLVRNVVDLVRAHPDAEGRTVRIAEPHGGDLPVYGDEDLIHRAVLNLVLNAVQWAGDDGKVEVSLDRLHSDMLTPALGPVDAVRIRVSDSGPGVPAEVLDHIFDPFVTHRPGGTGLGLALVQRAAEAHGGAVFVDNQHAPDASGATFSLYLPASSAAEAQLVAEPTLSLSAL